MEANPDPPLGFSVLPKGMLEIDILYGYDVIINIQVHFLFNKWCSTADSDNTVMTC